MSNSTSPDEPAAASLPTPPLLERGAVLDTWARALDTVDGGGTSTLVIGEPGVGKSRLLDAGCHAASERGITVLRASGGELEQRLTFGVARDLFASAVADTPHEDLFAGYAGPARALLRPDDGAATADPGLDELGMARALFWVLDNLTEAVPVAVVVDDLQWVDDATLTFLAYLVRRVADLPAAVLLARRPTGERVLLRQLTVASTHVSPAPLSVEATSRLVTEWAWPGSTPHPALVDACASASGGNPFLLCSLLRAVRARASQPDADAAATARAIAPDDVLAWIGARLAELPAAAAALAEAASVLPAGCSLAVAGQVACVALTDAPALLAELELADVVRPVDGRLHFTHPLVRDGVYRRIEEPRRGRLHKLAADVLRAEHAPVDVVADRLLDAPPSADREAAACLRDAARWATEHGAHDLAVRFLLREVQEACELDTAARLERDRVVAAALVRIASPDADRWFQGVLSNEPDPVVRARDSGDLGRARFARGEFAAAAQAFEQGRSTIEGLRRGGAADGDRRRGGAAVDDRGAAVSDDELAQLELELTAGWASSTMFTPQIAQEGVAARVRQIIDPSVEPSTTAQRVALSHVAGLDAIVGVDRVTCTELAERAWEGGRMLSEVGCDEPSLWGITVAFGCAARFREARDVAIAIQQEAQRVGAAAPWSTATYISGVMDLMHGSLAEAAVAFDRSVEGVSTAATPGWDTFLPAAIGARATVAVAMGELELADRLLARDPAEEEAWSQALVHLPVLSARAMLAAEQGRHADALAGWTRVRDHALRVFGRDPNPAWIGGWRCGAVDALLALDRREEALELARQELDVAAAWGADSGLGRALRAVARSEPEGRIERLEESVARLASCGAQLERARSTVDMGQALRAAGLRTDARSVLREALDLADSIGAVPLARRARADLVVLGARPRRDRTSGAAALTATERRVASLAASGRSNREIAEELYVTMHAIRYHLRNTYAKLGVDDRADLAAALAFASPPASEDLAR